MIRPQQNEVQASTKSAAMINVNHVAEGKTKNLIEEENFKPLL